MDARIAKIKRQSGRRRNGQRLKRGGKKTTRRRRLCKTRRSDDGQEMLRENTESESARSGRAPNRKMERETRGKTVEAVKKKTKKNSVYR